MLDDKLKSTLFGVRPDPLGKKKDAFPEGEPDESKMQDVGPCGWVWVKGCKAIDVERGAEPVATLQYVYLSVLSEFKPTSFWVLFVGLQHWKVTVEGRNLRALYDRMNDHCLRRIRKADRDFGDDDGKPFVLKLEVKDVTPKEG
jgi:hypothetical protein